MQFPIVREYKTDIRNTNPENEIRQEPFSVDAGVWTRVIVPRHSPFFVDSLKLYFPNGQPMVPNKHFRVFSLMSRITDLCGHQVSCTIELMDENITDGLIDYDVVGEFSLFDTTLANMVTNASNDDRPVYWEHISNKPVVFPPTLHGHSLLYDVVAFMDLIEFFDLLSATIEEQGSSILQVKLRHALTMLNHYMAEYKAMLLAFLERHERAYNEHGLTAEQVNLEKVDNFATATTLEELRSSRTDLHLTVKGLRTLIGAGGGSGEGDFLPEGKLPISQFGNRYSYPPLIQGRYEAMGGKLETAGIVEEKDGALTFLWNRFDGRTRGLYYSSVQRPGPMGKLDYTGYPYKHARFATDNNAPDLIAQGSGGEVLLIADSFKEVFYVGLTYGTLNPDKHKLSIINMSAVQAITGGKLTDYMQHLHVALLGDWIYIFLAKSGTAGGSHDMRYRYLFRVSALTVATQAAVTAARVNTTYVDGDGVQVNAGVMWRWCTPTGSGEKFSKWYHTFTNSALDIQCFGACNGQLTFVTPMPDQPGKFLVKFVTEFWVAHLPTGKVRRLVLDMTNIYDPATLVMTLVHKTPKLTVDLTDDTVKYPVIPREFFNVNHNPGALITKTGELVMASSSGNSYPRNAGIFSSELITSRAQVMASNLGVTMDQLDRRWVYDERIIQPQVSGSNPKAFMLGNGGDFFVATNRSGGASLFYNNAPGGLRQRPEVVNLAFPAIRSRPPSIDVREVDLPPVVGGFTITFPSNYLAGFGLDVADHRFCVSVQKQHLDQFTWPSGWPRGTDPDDVVMVDDHTRTVNANGKIAITPTATLTYPAAIVRQLKQLVANPAGMAASPKVFVTICDPSILNTKYGWLPVLVLVTYMDGPVTRRQTLLSIQPIYTAGPNRVVTGFSLLNASHGSYQTLQREMSDWNAYMGGMDPTTGLMPMRAGYYLHDDTQNGFNKFNLYFDSGVISKGAKEGESGGSVNVSYVNRNTRLWDGLVMNYPWRTAPFECIVLPDNGVDLTLGAAGAGFANAVFKDTRSVATPATMYNQLGPVYPYSTWVLNIPQVQQVVFNGKFYNVLGGSYDLRDYAVSPTNRTFYLYVKLDSNNRAVYDLSLEKRAETPFHLWVAKVMTDANGITSVESFELTTIDGHRVSETKRGGAIPAVSGSYATEGKLPWIRSNELLP